MGVPTFFRWLTMRNPKMVLDCMEPEDNSGDSLNPMVDNFYVDMNGLIHPSCNPQPEHNIRLPANFQEQCENIFEYLDKLMSIVRPRKLLYLAIDGVAPRAKMNQQRSRRFRAARESLQNQERKKKLRDEYMRNGMWTQDIEDYVNRKSFDSNVITPGTQFLSNVSLALSYYVQNRMNQHPHWKGLTVVFSDANCPGQGEHKIMQFIRQQRACADYQPNQSHCLYGADADLIMLGLMTHQPQFYIIRETIVPADQKRCTICNGTGHFFMTCHLKDTMETEFLDEQSPNAINVNFQMLRLQLVREQLHLCFCKVEVPFGYDMERIIDDFVFMCFFVGNDFLPHLPTLNIRDGGIDILMYIYECVLAKMPDYLINAGVINWKSLDIFLGELAKVEQNLVDEAIKRESIMRQRESWKNGAAGSTQQRQQRDGPGAKRRAGPMEPVPTTLLDRFKDELKGANPDEIDLEDYSVFNHPLMSCKEKFYTEKFRIEPCDFTEFRCRISQAYLEALAWIALYYYKGVASWSWFYPFHYSPFVSDVRIALFNNQGFEKGRPFQPFEQLMAVFPQKTSWAVPQCLQPLINDQNSPIADYFPTDFVIDTLGKKFAWLGEVLLPFIEEDRLLTAMTGYEEKLTPNERIRNRRGDSIIFYNVNDTQLRKEAQSNKYLTHKNSSIEGELKEIRISPPVVYSPLDNNWPSIENNRVEVGVFVEPEGKHHDIHLKPGTRQSEPEIDQEYIMRTDKKSYNGQRMVRLLETLIERPRKEGQRRPDDFMPREHIDSRPDYRSNMQKRYRDNQPSQDNRNRRPEEPSRRRSRSRSRDKPHRQNSSDYRDEHHRHHHHSRH